MQIRGCILLAACSSGLGFLLLVFESLRQPGYGRPGFGGNAIRFYGLATTAPCRGELIGIQGLPGLVEFFECAAHVEMDFATIVRLRKAAEELVQRHNGVRVQILFVHGPGRV